MTFWMCYLTGQHSAVFNAGKTAAGGADRQYDRLQFDISSGEKF